MINKSSTQKNTKINNNQNNNYFRGKSNSISQSVNLLNTKENQKISLTPTQLSQNNIYFNNNNNQTSSSLIKSLNPKTILVCPDCKTTIPTINQYLLDTPNTLNISLLISCEKCKSKKKSFVLNDILKDNKSDIKINYSNYCPIHTNKPLIYYCIRCCQKICNLCSNDAHKGHKLQTHNEYFNSIDENLPFHNYNNFEIYCKEFINIYTKYKIDVSYKITEKILELNKLKKDVEDALNKNIKINENLIELTRILYRNYLNSNKNITILDNFNKICQFNNFKFEIPSKSNTIISIEKLSYELIDFFQTNFIIHPFHIYKKSIFESKLHKSGITCLIQLKNNINDYIITGSIDKTLKVWDIHKTYTSIKSLIGHQRAINSLIELYNGNVMSVSSDMNILFWDMNSFQLITFLKSSHTSFIFSCIELSDKRLITGSDDSSIVIYKKGTYEKITNEDFPSAVFSLIEIKSYTNRKRIAVGCGDYSIYLCYINNKYFDSFDKVEIKGHKGGVRALLQLKDERLLSGSNDNLIKVWDISDYNKNNIKCLFTIQDHYLYINYMIQLKDNRILTASFDDTIKLFNIYNFKCLSILKGHKSTNGMVQMKDGRICSGSSDCKLIIWY